VTASSQAVRLMRDLAAHNDLWLTGTRPLLAAQAPSIELDKDLKGYSAAIELGEGMKFEARLDFSDSTAAQRMLAAIRQKQIPPETAVHFSTELDATSVRLAFAISQGEISKAIETALAGSMGKQLSAMAAAFTHAQNKITVYGAEGGTQEISSGHVGPSPAVGSGLVIRDIQGGEPEPAPPSTSAMDATKGAVPRPQ